MKLVHMISAYSRFVLGSDLLSSLLVAREVGGGRGGYKSSISAGILQWGTELECRIHTVAYQLQGRPKPYGREDENFCENQRHT